MVDALREYMKLVNRRQSGERRITTDRRLRIARVADAIAIPVRMGLGRQVRAQVAIVAPAVAIEVRRAGAGDTVPRRIGAAIAGR